MSRETYVTIEQAKALKRLGFDWPTCTRYDFVGREDIYAGFKNHNGDVDITSRPELHLAAKWLREVKHCHANAFLDDDCKEWHTYCCDMKLQDSTSIASFSDLYRTYEDALSAAITVALNYLETCDAEKYF